MLKLTQAVVEQLVRQTTGAFQVKILANELGELDESAKGHLRVIMHRLCKDGIAATVPARGDGWYRLVDTEVVEMGWQEADITNVVSLKFPFELERYVKIYPRSIICVAGGKDAGKTAWLYDFTLKNMYHPLGIDLYNSETGKEQMRERMDNFGIEISTPPPFRTFERYDNFADVIDKDRISVIDYLDLNSEVYLVGDEIDRMFRKSDKGIVVIGLQKPPPTVTYVKGVKKLIYRDLAYGSGFTAKRAVLYISLDGGILKLVVAKTPVDPAINPKNMMWSFRIKDGAIFYDIKRFIQEDFEE